MLPPNGAWVTEAIPKARLCGQRRSAGSAGAAALSRTVAYSREQIGQSRPCCERRNCRLKAKARTTYTYTHIQLTRSHAHTHTRRHADTQTNIHTDIQTYKHTNIQTYNIHTTYTHTHVCILLENWYNCIQYTFPCTHYVLLDGCLSFTFTKHGMSAQVFRRFCFKLACMRTYILTHARIQRMLSTYINKHLHTFK